MPFFKKRTPRSEFGDFIKNRKKIIIKSLLDAADKFVEAEDSLKRARQNLEKAKSKAEQIRKNGLIISSQTSKVLLEGIEDEIKRINQVGLTNFILKEEKALSDVYQKLTKLAFDNALEKIQKKLNANLLKKIMKKKITRLYYLYSRY